ncbi:nucleoside-diphosphate-sugar epimerase [Xenococcus sp. PCC 7305]|uniref:NAD-dependent epimerase n=1 Tax=Xenococcus sp. PCC 7305 TaxID=102125 RepID=UPI0002ACBD62|nr:NAD-dependent epimerase [Xenococcus sp. PCC 7305]ELS04971.1 nucleoside-diphosphate-sugar epimerase [Xenococcus sp. PCC 7305]
MKILITGIAGFIGYHLAKRLLSDGCQIHGIDNLNDYYDVNLKQDRLAQLLPDKKFVFNYLDISDRASVTKLFSQHKFDFVVHLAAQAGVRYSLNNPYAYVDSNLVGFTNILEGCRHNKIQHLVFASSSSVYGANTKIPFAVTDNVDHPISLYAATKKANELIAHAYSHLYQIPVTGLRFFTVYGPWGRPDMAYFKFVKAIAERQSIDVYNFGKMKRDFTYIDDIVEGVVRVIKKIPQSTSQQSSYKIYNIGNNNPIELNDFITTIEEIMGQSTHKKLLPMQPGDVVATWADIDELMVDIGFQPTTSIEVGLRKFVQWYQEYYGNSSNNKKEPALLHKDNK